MPAVLPDLQHLAGARIQAGGRRRVGDKLCVHRHIIDPGVGFHVNARHHHHKGRGLIDGAILLVPLPLHQVKARRQALLRAREHRKPLRIRFCAVRRHDLIPQDIAIQRGSHLVPCFIVFAPDIHIEQGECLRRRQFAAFVHRGHEVNIKLCAAQVRLAVHIGNGQAHVAVQFDAPCRMCLHGQEQHGCERAQQRGSDAFKPLHRRHLHVLCWAAWAAATGSKAKAASGSPRWAPRAAARSVLHPP